MSEDRTYYDSTAPLEWRDLPAHLHRRIGVRAENYAPKHAGIGGPAYLIGTETIALNTASYGRWVPEAEVEQHVTASMERTLADLDAALVELWKHRERMATEHLKRTGQYPDSPAMLPILKMLRDQLAESDELVAALKPFISQIQREALAELPDDELIELGPDRYRVVITLGDLRRLWAAFDEVAGIEETALS